MPFFKRRRLRAESLTTAQTRARTEALLNDFEQLMRETQDPGRVFASVLGFVVSKGADLVSFHDERSVGAYRRDGLIVTDVRYGDQDFEVVEELVGTPAIEWAQFGVAIQRWAQHVARLAKGTCGRCPEGQCATERHLGDAPMTALARALSELMNALNVPQPTRDYLGVVLTEHQPAAMA